MVKNDEKFKEFMRVMMMSEYNVEEVIDDELQNYALIPRNSVLFLENVKF